MEQFTENGAAAVDRAIAILRAFGANDRWLTLSELSRRTGLYKSTLLRLINSLMAARLLIKGDDGYTIGPEALRLGSIYERNYDLRDTVMPILRELAQEVNETCSFYVREGDHRVCLHKVEPDRTLKMQTKPGAIMPLSGGAGGRILAAFSGFEGELMDRIRAEHFYYSNGEVDPETAGISAPVFGAGNQLIGAIVITTPSMRLNNEIAEKWRPVLEQSAKLATNNLGGRPW